MYERLEKCPVCNQDKLNNYFICKDFVVSGESFALTQCENCKLIFTNPRPRREFINKYYESPNYVPHSKDRSFMNTIYRWVRIYNNRNKLKVISEYSEKGNILDVGCGTGNFLEYCKNKNWEVAGIEPVESAAKIASSVLSLPILQDILQVEESSSFQVITFWHVLEHIYNLHEVIEKVKKLLARNGRIFIALPNNQSLDCLNYKEYWAAFDVPRHLWHFNPSSFSNFIKDHGLKIQAIIPMHFDAYYISLLSEENKSGRKNWTKAIINGYKSNSYGKKNNDNFSSLIYVIKK